MPDIDLSFQSDSYPPEVFSYRHHMSRWGVDKARAKKIVRKFKEERVMVSSTHQVALNAFLAPMPFGGGTWLSIKQVDKGVIAERQTLARIMRTLLPGHGGFELLPAPQRLVDTANQYHVWAFPVGNLQALTSAPLGEVQRHARGFEFQALELLHDDGNRHLVVVDAGPSGDWRDLYERKEAYFPGCEGCVYFHESEGHPFHGRMLCLAEPGFVLPFGFRDRAVADVDTARRTGGQQRELASYAKPPARGGLPTLKGAARRGARET